MENYRSQLECDAGDSSDDETEEVKLQYMLPKKKQQVRIGKL